MADRFPTAGESEEQCTHDSGFLAGKNTMNSDLRIMLDHAIPTMALQTISDTISVVTGASNFYQIGVDTVTELESVPVVPIISEGVHGDESRITINQTTGENVPTHELAMSLITRAILIVGFLTVIADGRTALFKPATGIFFSRNKLAYYVALAVIFACGVIELFTGIWVSVSSLPYRRRLWIGGIVLFLSICPLVGILSIDGLA